MFIRTVVAAKLDEAWGRGRAPLYKVPCHCDVRCVACISLHGHLKTCGNVYVRALQTGRSAAESGALDWRLARAPLEISNHRGANCTQFEVAQETHTFDKVLVTEAIEVAVAGIAQIVCLAYVVQCIFGGAAPVTRATPVSVNLKSFRRRDYLGD